jgi:transposase
VERKRRELVAAVRRGESQRSVARRFGVHLRTVQRWVARAGNRRLDRVAWSDQPRGPRHAPRRADSALEAQVVALRRRLRQESDLGEFGAEAIAAELRRQAIPHPPCARTIHRILRRCGALDGAQRTRRAAPPRGWYLPDLAAERAELDQFDLVEDLKIEDGPLVGSLNVVALHSRLVGALPNERFTAARVRELLTEHWREVGLPDYAQFDNDTRFQGPHQHRDVVGSVSRLCLSLGISPVFIPPGEVGFQAAIESFNGLWQAKVWRRFHYPDLAALQAQSGRYVAAHRRRTTAHGERAPERATFPADWQLNLQAPPAGILIYLRRTTDQGRVSLLGRTFAVDPAWPHRLVRCEVDLDQHHIRFYALRRREPTHQPLLNQLPYQLPNRRFKE